MDWPIRYKDLAPWYDYVEGYIGVSGENVGLSQFPDGKLFKAHGADLCRRSFKI